MLSVLKYILLFRYMYLQQETWIASSWCVEQLSLSTASAERRGEVDGTTAEATGTGLPRERSLVPFAEVCQKRKSNVCDASVCKRT